MRRIGLKAALALAGAAGLTGAAVAATPDAGTIGKSAAKVAWEGNVPSGASFYVWQNGDPSAPCGSGQTCDSFALTVTDDGDVVIKLRLQRQSGTTSGANGNGAIRVTAPDDSVFHAEGESGPKTDLVLKIPGAKAGEYTVDVTPSFVNGAPYTASADWFPVGGSAPKPAPEEPAPAPSEPQPQQPANEAFTIDAKAGKVSAKKAKKGKSIAVKVTTSRAVEQVTATLKQGKKTLGTGRVAPFGGSGTLKVKLAKALKKGTYTLTVVGRDKNVQAAKTIKVKVAK